LGQLSSRLSLLSVVVATFSLQKAGQSKFGKKTALGGGI